MSRTKVSMAIHSKACARPKKIEIRGNNSKIELKIQKLEARSKKTSKGGWEFGNPRTGKYFCHPLQKGKIFLSSGGKNIFHPHQTGVL